MGYHSNLNPECNTKRGCKNQLYIELGVLVLIYRTERGIAVNNIERSICSLGMYLLSIVHVIANLFD